MTLPAFSYAPHDVEHGGSVLECAVCLGAVKEGEMVRQLPAYPPDEIRIRKHGSRQIDRDLDRHVVGGKAHPIRRGFQNDEIGQHAKMRVSLLGQELRRRDNPPGRMTHPDQRLGAAYRQGARIDLRLVPEFQPVIAERLDNIDWQGRRRSGGEQIGDPLARLRGDLMPLGIERAEGNCEPEDHAATLCEIPT